MEYYKGNFVNLKRSGQGYYENKSNGLSYEGEWENDEFNGDGVLSLDQEWVYKGAFKNGNKEGTGEVFYLKSGNFFKGEFKDNLKTGEGEMMWVSENQFYKGNWYEDELSGFGFYVYLSVLNKKKNLRNYYIGEFNKNNRDGFGIHFYSDSSVYIGFWNKGLKNETILFIDNMGYLYIKEFVNNHLKSSERLFIENKNDYSIPIIKYVENNIDEEWNYQTFEKVVKSFNPFLRKIFEEITSEEIFNKVIKGLKIEDLLKLFADLRFYDSELNCELIIQIFKISKNCFFNTKIKEKEFLEIKRKFDMFMKGKIKNFNLSFEFHEKNSILNYREFLNCVFLVFQYKFKDSLNIEKKIRNFFKHRFLNVFNNKLKIKEWVKNEVSILQSFADLKSKNNSTFLEIFNFIKGRKSNLLIKDLLDYLKGEKLLFIQKDLGLFLRVVERYKDPLTSNYDDFRIDVKTHKLFTNPKFVNLLFSQISFQEFVDDLILFVYSKEKKKNLHPFEPTFKIIGNLKIPKILPKIITKRIVKNIFNKKMSEKENQDVNLSIENIDVEEIEKKKSIKLETPRNIREIVHMRQNDVNMLKINLNQESRNFDEDSFKTGYFDDLNNENFSDLNK